MRISTVVKESLDRYANDHLATGGFLRAVLANDLAGAVGRADLDNTFALVDIVRYIWNQLPSECHGSYEAVDRWLAKENRAA